MAVKRKVILVTDGDRIAQKAVETATRNIGGRCISASAGNPTPLSGPRIVDLIKEAKQDPVVVMFDDNGSNHRGQGEQALLHVANHPDLEVMGVVAVASNSDDTEKVKVDCAVTKDKHVITGQVNKEGSKVSSDMVVAGDTVGVLNSLPGLFMVGVGDLGKMEGRDNPQAGAAVTTQALQTIIDHWNSLPQNE